MSGYKRRAFIKFSLATIAGGALYVWDKMFAMSEKNDPSMRTTVPYNPTKQVVFYKDFIVVNRAGVVTVYTSHCSHLGCVINKKEKGLMACPCHGSLFDLSGVAVKGPAYKALKKLPYHWDKSGKNLIVKVG